MKCKKKKIVELTLSCSPLTEKQNESIIVQINEGTMSTRKLDNNLKLFYSLFFS